MSATKPHQIHHSVSPGPELASPVAGYARNSINEHEFAHFSGEFWTMLKNPPLLCFGGGIPYASGEGTETKDNSATIAMVGGGLRFQTQASPSANDDCVFFSARQQTLAADMILCGTITMQASVIAEVGLTFGVCTSGVTEAQSANPTDCILVHSANNAATIIGRVVANGGTAADVTLGTGADSTDVRVSYSVIWDADGAIAAADWFYNGTRTAFTADQRTALAAMLATTPPTLQGIVGMRGPNSTTQRRAIVKSAFTELH